MANRFFPNIGHFYSTHNMPVLVDVKFSIGAAGAITANSVKGPGVTGVTKLATGIYQIQLADNYNNFYGMWPSMVSPVTGAAVADGSFVVGTAYQITVVGTTNWQAAGLPAGITPAVGQAFVATSIGGAGTGTATAVGVSGVSKIELLGDPSLTIAPAPQNAGSIIDIQCLGPTAAGNTALIPTNPASGSIIKLAMYLSNSSVQIAGE